MAQRTSITLNDTSRLRLDALEKHLDINRSAVVALGLAELVRKESVYVPDVRDAKRRGLIEDQ